MQEKQKMQERKQEDKKQMKVGLIGLGIMGKPMAKNILKGGYELMVSDLNKAAVEESMDLLGL